MSARAIEAAERFEALLSEENALLRQGDFVGATALAPRKEELVTALNQATAADPALLVQPDFTDLGLRLHRLATENKALLEGAMRAQVRMIRMIAAIPTSQSVVYRRDGSFMRPPLRRSVLLSEPT